MTSTERIIEYAHLPSEESLGEKMKPPKEWPSAGEIRFSKLTLSYASLTSPALKSISAVIKGGEKVGIVGRTGSGKSSLISALFRLTKYEGSIEIDGFDIHNMTLNELRNEISIVPQDAMLFSGSIRFNLDPNDQHTDAILWQVLENVGLKSVFDSRGITLDTPLLDGGQCLSVGQNQLLRLARILLRRNKIVVLDEATANIDTWTEKKVQTLLKENFNEVTVIIIAHRLTTIMGCDRIMVLDLGNIVEFDEPVKLLQNEFGYLKQLAKRSGDVKS